VIAAFALALALGTPVPTAPPKLCGPSRVALIRERTGIARGVGRVYKSATEAGYSLVAFGAGEGGVDALFHRESGRWCLLAKGGGMMPASLLVSQGVPPATARRLSRAVNGAAEGG